MSDSLYPQEGDIAAEATAQAQDTAVCDVCGDPVTLAERTLYLNSDGSLTLRHPWHA